METEQDTKWTPLFSVLASEHMSAWTTLTQHPFQTGVLIKLRIEGACTNIPTLLHDTARANIILMGRN